MEGISEEAVLKMQQAEKEFEALPERVIVRTDIKNTITKNNLIQLFDKNKEEFMRNEIVSIGKIAAKNTGLKVGDRVATRISGGIMLAVIVVKKHEVAKTEDTCMYKMWGGVELLFKLND